MQAQSFIRHYEWVNPTTLELGFPTNRLRLYFAEAGVVRCRYVSHAVFENIPSYGVAPEYRYSDVPLEEAETEKYIEIRTSRLIVRVRRKDGGIEFYERAGERLLSADAEGMGHRLQERTGDELVWVLKELPEEAHFYALGDKPCALNLRGRRFEMWGSDHYKFNTESDPLYKSIPFFLCLNKGTQYGIFFDNTIGRMMEHGNACIVGSPMAFIQYIIRLFYRISGYFRFIAITASGNVHA